MSRVSAWRCQWPTNRALAVAEGLGEPLGLETLPGLELAAPVVEDVAVLDEFFEHPAAASVTIAVAAMAITSPRFATEAFAVISLSHQSTDWHTP
jgi:hypothetical protein